MTVFCNYSGVSNRLDEIFWDHQRNFYKKIIKKDFDSHELDDLRRLFYVKQIHSFFVLMAFFALQRIEKKSKDFLLEVLGIEDLESVLFVLKEAKWENKDGGDPRFWGAEGLVKDFLSVLWEFAYVPIYHKATVYPDFRSKGVKENHLYLFLKDKKALKDFASKYFNQNEQKPSNTFLFKALESSYISEMLKEVRVRVKKRKDGEVTFKELSEGEQQLLTVIGLLIFTREDESLVLLDEPDTHLNPLWKYDYLHYLKTLVKSKDALESEADPEDRTTQILINTHDPIVMDKSQVRMFGKQRPSKDSNEKGGTEDKFEQLKAQALSEAIEPDESPRGLGFAGILTSEMFGFKTILDRETNQLLDERNQLLYKESIGKLTEKDKKRLQVLFEELSQKGFNHIFKDPLYSEYIIEKLKSLEGN